VTENTESSSKCLSQKLGAVKSLCFGILEGILSLEGILRNAPAFSRGGFSHPQNASETVTCGDGAGIRSIVSSHNIIFWPPASQIESTIVYSGS
jgi:hypothetical protein